LTATLLTLLTLAAAVAWTVDRVATSGAENDAAIVGEFTARVHLSPHITDDLLDGDPDAVAAIAKAGEELLSTTAIEHVKIWSKDGTIVWADEERLVGKRFELEASEISLLETGGVSAEVSNLDLDENALDTTADGSHRLLEVYYTTNTESGRRLLVETYYPYQLVSDQAGSVRRRLLPVAIGGMAVLALLQVPVVVALARRLIRSQADRQRLFEVATERRDREHRRIVGLIHDSAVQDLIGVSFTLAGSAKTAPRGMAELLGALGEETRRIAGSLRSLLESIYPIRVPSTGWIDGLEDAVSTLRKGGVEVTIDVPRIELTPAEEQLLLQVSREVLRNVNAHAKAGHVLVSLSRRSGRLVLDIRDDGLGFDAGVIGGGHVSGHFGLPLISDLALDAGATLSIESVPGRGTDIRLEVLALT
jgi:signal transduction histidine kinase